MKKYVFLCGWLYFWILLASMLLEHYRAYLLDTVPFSFFIAPIIPSLFASWFFVKNEKRNPSKAEIKAYAFYAGIILTFIFFVVNNATDIYFEGLGAFVARWDRLFRITPHHARAYIAWHVIFFAIFYILQRLSFWLGTYIFYRLKNK